MKKFVFLFFLCPAFISCTSIMLKSYGLKQVYTVITDENRALIAENYDLKPCEWHELDISFGRYLLDSFYLNMDTLNRDKYLSSINNHLQPLQAMYFDKSGELISFYVNCYAGGFPNLRWNRNHSFDVFPPVTQAPLDSLVNCQTLAKYIKTQTGESLNPEFNTCDYTIVVLWGDCMGRQSERLMRLVRKNRNLALPEQNVNVIFVNNDDFGMQMNALIKELQ